MIGIVDYGMGNLGSVANAFEYIDQPAVIIDVPAKLEDCERIVLPGVGSFAQAMNNLDGRNWSGPLRGAACAGKPFLGICLGMQLLFDMGEEHGQSVGLGLISGRVTRLHPQPMLRIPHVGWNSLVPVRKHPVLAGIKDEMDFYFVHSFQCEPANFDSVIARCDYGGEFVAVAGHGNIIGVQFHPEKSQDAGLKLLDNFARWDGKC